VFFEVTDFLSQGLCVHLLCWDVIFASAELTHGGIFWWYVHWLYWLRAGRSGDRIPVGARFSAPVQTGPAAHPASCTMGTGSFPGIKCGRGMTLIPQPLLVQWSRKSRATPLLPLWAVRPVQSLSACTGVHFNFYLSFNTVDEIKTPDSV